MENSITTIVSQINNDLFEELVTEAGGEEFVIRYVMESDTPLVRRVKRIADLVDLGVNAVYDAAYEAMQEGTVIFDLEGDTIVNEDGTAMDIVDIATLLEGEELRPSRTSSLEVQTLVPLGQYVKPSPATIVQSQPKFGIPAQKPSLSRQPIQQTQQVQPRYVGNQATKINIRPSPKPQQAQTTVMNSSTRMSQEDAVFFKELEALKMDLLRDIHKTLTNSVRSPRKKVEVVDELRAGVANGSFTIDDIRDRIPPSASPVRNTVRATTTATYTPSTVATRLAPTTSYGQGRTAPPLPVIQSSGQEGRMLPGLAPRLSAAAQLYIDAIATNSIDDIIGALKMYVPIGANAEKYLRDNISSYEKVLAADQTKTPSSLEGMLKTTNLRALLSTIPDQDLLFKFNVYVVHKSRDDLINQLVYLADNPGFFKPLSNTCTNINYDLQSDVEGLVAYGTITDYFCFTGDQVQYDRDNDRAIIMVDQEQENDIQIDSLDVSKLRTLAASLPSYAPLLSKLR